LLVAVDQGVLRGEGRGEEDVVEDAVVAGVCEASSANGDCLRAYFGFGDGEEGNITYCFASHCTGEIVVEF